MLLRISIKENVHRTFCQMHPLFSHQLIYKPPVRQFQSPPPLSDIFHIPFLLTSHVQLSQSGLPGYLPEYLT